MTPTLSLAQNAQAYGLRIAPTSAPEAIGYSALALVSAAFEVKPEPRVPKDQIRGFCSMRASPCPGAQVSLKAVGSNEEITYQTISSSLGFTFTSLKPGKYVIEVTYPRYRIKKSTTVVSTGSEVMINLEPSAEPK